MKRVGRRNRWGTLMLLALGAMATGAQMKLPATAPVVMLSDIHFDPFHDPTKLAKLQAAPVSHWARLLDAPDSATQAAETAALQKTCPVRGVDTPWPLLKSSLAAARSREARTMFVTVSGDLLAHAFDCRFKALTPNADENSYAEFASKTVAFVALELRVTFAPTPVYIALGNNDSGCGDYQESPDSDFLHATANSFAQDVDTRNRKAVLKEASDEGDYSVVLPKPMDHARLIVLQDIFESKRYRGCGKDISAGNSAGAAQLAWLRAQLAAAHAQHENVWVMAHIPPGVDVYSTFSKRADVCAGQAPEMFLGSEQIVDALTEYGGNVKLAIFAHTHMDEMRLLHGSAKPASLVPVKLVPSISPVNGNNPSFTVAQINPQNAMLMDYTVYEGNNQTGEDTKWTKEYSYAETYGLPDFSAQTLGGLFAGFRADKTGSSYKSQAYARNFFVGGNPLRAMALQLAWPAYACSLTENTEAGFRSCLCPAVP